MTMVEEKPRFWGRVAGSFYMMNVILGSLALVFVRRKLAFYADAMTVAAAASYVVVTALFYLIFKPAGRRISLLAAIFSFAGCALSAMTSLRLATSPVNPLGLFGVYCLLLGYLTVRSAFLPRVLGVLLVIGGLSWLTFLSHSLADLLMPYNMAPGILAEVILTLWLLIRGIDAPRWKEQAAAANFTTTRNPSLVLPQ